MNVLIVHAGKGFYGGAEEVIIQLCNYLYQHGHNYCVVGKDLPTKAKGGGFYNTHNWLRFREEVRRNLNRADVINVHNFPATLAPFPTRKPIVWMCNEPPELFTNWKRKPIEAFNRWWVKKSKMEVVVADWWQATRFQEIYGIEPQFFPYGIDYKFWSAMNRDKSMKIVFGRTYGSKNKPFRILQVGTVSNYKNQLESLCTLAELTHLGLDATLTLAGSYTVEPNYFADLQDYLFIANEEHPGFLKKVTFLGQQTKEQVRDLFQSHDVLIHPVEEQGGWLVPFESMCSELPVVVSPKFTGADIIKDNQLGYVTDVYTLAIKQLIEDKGKPDPITPHAKEWVKENLTWEKFGEGMVKVFEEAELAFKAEN